jgi:protein PsiE
MSLFDFNGQDVSRRLHWTTLYTEKTMLAVIGGLTVVAASQSVWEMALAQKVTIADLFLLFIYTEIIGMVGAFFVSSRIPVTLPIIIAMTALCRLIVLHGKDSDPLVVIAEAAAILVLSVAAYIMSLKDARSLKKANSQTDDSLKT